MVRLILIVALYLVSVPVLSQKATLSLMYRRSGHTALAYDTITSGETVSFYKRDGNPFFRVYQMRFMGPYKTRKITVESYKNGKLLKSTVPRIGTNIGNRLTFNDTYVSEDEDSAKVIMDLVSQSGEGRRFIFYITLDRKFSYD